MSESNEDSRKPKADLISQWRRLIGRHAKFVVSLKLALILASSAYTWKVLGSTAGFLSQRDVLESLVTESWKLRCYDFNLGENFAKRALAQANGSVDPQLEVSYRKTAFLMERSLLHLQYILDDAQMQYSSSIYGGLDNFTMLHKQRVSQDMLIFAGNISQANYTVLLDESRRLHQLFAAAVREEEAFATTYVTRDLESAYDQATQLRTIAFATVGLCASLELLVMGTHVRELRKAKVGWLALILLLLMSAGASVEESLSRIKIIDELRNKLSYIHNEVLPALAETQKLLYYDAVGGYDLAIYALATLNQNNGTASDAYGDAAEAWKGWGLTLNSFLSREITRENPVMGILYGDEIKSWKAYSEVINAGILADPTKASLAFQNTTYRTKLSQYDASINAISNFLEMELAATLEASGDATYQLLHLSVVLTVLAIVVILSLEYVARTLVREKKLRGGGLDSEAGPAAVKRSAKA